MAAALATIDEFERHDVLAHNHRIGRALLAACTEAVAAAGMHAAVEVLPCDWMVTFVCRDVHGQPCHGMRTLLMQEMIARGILFQGLFVPCWSHSDADVARFVQAFTQSLAVYAQALEQGYTRYLVGEPAKPVFRKYV